MKDKNGIEICCENCDVNAQRDCCLWNKKGIQEAGSNDCQEYFYPSYKAYEARIEELEKENEKLLDCLVEHNLKVNVRENRTLEECEEMSTQSTDVCEMSKNSKNSTESEEK